MTEENVKNQLTELIRLAVSKEDYGVRFEDLADVAIKYFVSILPEEKRYSPNEESVDVWMNGWNSCRSALEAKLNGG